MLWLACISSPGGGISGTTVRDNHRFRLFRAFDIMDCLFYAEGKAFQSVVPTGCTSITVHQFQHGPRKPIILSHASEKSANTQDQSYNPDPQSQACGHLRK